MQKLKLVILNKYKALLEGSIFIKLVDYDC